MAGLVFALAGAAPSLAMAADVDARVLAELNFARAHPQSYAQRLLLHPVSDWESQLSAADRADDPQAFAEAVAFLMRQAPLAPLQADAGLAAAALEHVASQGPAGEVGHEGADGEPFDTRLRRHGLHSDWAAENIAYGPDTAEEVVRALIIDQGVPDRGHRLNIFQPQLAQAGVGCGAHIDYAFMCVIDFAGPDRTVPSPPRRTGVRTASLPVRSTP